MADDSNREYNTLNADEELKTPLTKRDFAKELKSIAPVTPHFPYVAIKDSVCSLPLSIAYTYGIAIAFFSFGY